MLISSSGDEKPNIDQNTVLTLDFKTNIIDSETENQENLFDFKNKVKKHHASFHDRSDKNAKTDPNIKGISIETDHIGAGITQLDNLRAALLDFKNLVSLYMPMATMLINLRIILAQ
jgi:protease-4